MPTTYNEKMKSVYEVFSSFAFSISMVITVFIFLISHVVISGISMQPTLNSGDRIIAFSGIFTPKKDDIVVIANPAWGPTPNDYTIIKRVVATEGDKIDINYETGEVFLNDEVLEESYLMETIALPNYPILDMPLTVPKGFVFVMGDNRNHSIDSRNVGIGLIDRNYIIGKVWFRFFTAEA